MRTRRLKSAGRRSEGGDKNLIDSYQQYKRCYEDFFEHLVQAKRGSVFSVFQLYADS
jgi:hypothetical protein